MLCFSDANPGPVPDLNLSDSNGLERTNSGEHPQGSNSEPSGADSKGNLGSPASPTPMDKGLDSLANTVLRGSFTKFLGSDRLDFFDEIATRAFTEILMHNFQTITPNSQGLSKTGQDYEKFYNKLSENQRKQYGFLHRVTLRKIFQDTNHKRFKDLNLNLREKLYATSKNKYVDMRQPVEKILEQIDNEKTQIS